MTELEKVSKKYTDSIKPVELSKLFNPLYSYTEITNAFIAGNNWQKEQIDKQFAFTNLKDIKDAWQKLKEENPTIESSLSFLKGALWQKEQIQKETEQDKEYLEKALNLILELTEDDPSYMCDKLYEIPKENDYCAEHCTNFNRSCLLRFLKYYKKSDQQ